MSFSLLILCALINSLPKNKILDSSSLKAFTEDKKMVTQNLQFVLRSLENTVRKGEKIDSYDVQCTYPCFPGILLTSTPHNILSMPLAAFPHNNC